MSGFTDSELAMFLDDDETTNDNIVRDSTKVMSMTKTNMKVMFLSWIVKKKGEKTQRFDMAPNPEEFGDDAKMYKMKFEAMVLSVPPSKVALPVYDDKTLVAYDLKYTYDIKTKGRGKKVKEEYRKKTIDFILTHRDAAYGKTEERLNEYLERDIRKLIPEEGQTLVDGEIRRISPNEVLTFELCSFVETEVTTDLTMLTNFGLPQIRKGVVCDLQDVFPHYSVDTGKGKDGSVRLYMNAPQLRVAEIRPDASGLAADVGQIISENLSGRDQQFCVPFTLIDQGLASIPWQVQFHICHGDKLYNDTIMRKIMLTKKETDFITEKKKMHRREWVVEDWYHRSDGGHNKYRIIIQMWAPNTNSFGVDPTFWHDLMYHNQRIDYFAVASYLQKATSELDGNNTIALQFQEKEDKDIDGFFKFSILDGKPDYATWFRRSTTAATTLKLEAAEVLTLYLELNEKSKNNPNPRVIQKDDGQIEINTVLVDPASNPRMPTMLFNPLHHNRLLSPVINLGTPFRPMVLCEDDATPLFAKKNDFYVMFGTDKIPSKEEFLTTLARQKDYVYQIFVIQNFKNGKAKK